MALLEEARQCGSSMPAADHDPGRFQRLRDIANRMCVGYRNEVLPTIETFLAAYYPGSRSVGVTATVVIACSASKLPTPSPARCLYTGDLFVASRGFAEDKGLPLWIISAKHGVVSPDQVLEPYDCRVTGGRRSHAKPGSWSYRTAYMISNRIRPCHLVVLGGEHYRHPMTTWGSSFLSGFTWRFPLMGMEIGFQKQWLKKRTSEVGEILVH